MVWVVGWQVPAVCPRPAPEFIRANACWFGLTTAVIATPELCALANAGTGIVYGPAPVGAPEVVTISALLPTSIWIRVPFGIDTELDTVTAPIAELDDSVPVGAVAVPVAVTSPNRFPSRNPSWSQSTGPSMSSSPISTPCTMLNASLPMTPRPAMSLSHVGLSLNTNLVTGSHADGAAAVPGEDSTARPTVCFPVGHTVGADMAYSSGVSSTTGGASQGSR